MIGGGVERILYSIHTMAAMFVPEMEISEEESKKLTAALAGVNSFYAQSVDPKMLAWVELVGVAGAIYGPRAMAFMLRRKMEQEAKPPKAGPLAGTPTAPRSQPAQATQSAPQPRQAAPVSSLPPSIRAMVSDPTFVSDINPEE